MNSLLFLRLLFLPFVRGFINLAKLEFDELK